MGGFLQGAAKAAKGGSKGWLIESIRQYEQQLEAEKEAKRVTRQNEMDQSMMGYRNSRLEQEQQKLDQPKEPTAKELLDAEKFKNYMSLSPEDKKKADFPNLYKTEGAGTSQEERQTAELLDMKKDLAFAPGIGGSSVFGPPSFDDRFNADYALPVMEAALGVGKKPEKAPEAGKLSDVEKAPEAGKLSDVEKARVATAIKIYNDSQDKDKNPLTIKQALVKADSFMVAPNIPPLQEESLPGQAAGAPGGTGDDYRSMALDMLDSGEMTQEEFDDYMDLLDEQGY